MEVVGDVCESEGVCEVMCNLLSNQPEQDEFMETHVSQEEAACPADFFAAATGSEPNAAPLKPQYSYRLVMTKKISLPVSRVKFGEISPPKSLSGHCVVTFVP